MKRRRTAIRLLLILALATQLTIFTPTTNAGGVHNFQMYRNADRNCRNSEYSKGH